jgi:hypothetical protein
MTRTISIADRVATQQFELAEARLRSLRSRFGDRPLAGLALVPTWTEPLARAAEFPFDAADDLSRFLDDAEGAGLIEREPALRADPVSGRVFSIAESDRGALLRSMRQDSRLGPNWLRETARTIGDRLAVVDPRVMPDGVREWGELARTLADPFEAARSVRRQIEVMAGTIDVGQAHARVDALEALAGAIGGPLAAEIALASRRIELAYRREADRRHLTGFLARREQILAFHNLLDGREWALHYLGMGGVGKTMLLRHLTAELAPSLGLAVSRIDFDHLSPQFPTQRPGQLLLALAADLLGSGDTTKVGELIDQLAERVLELHEVLAEAPPPGQPLFNIRRGEFERILDVFCDLLVTVDRRVVLLVDTCEELARIPIDSGMLPSVEAMFDILERVHRRIPSLRVVFAGRRPLASSGAGWRLDASTFDDDAIAQRQAVLRPRPFLRLHEIRGFDEREARGFVDRSLDSRPSEALIRAILDSSHEARRATAIASADSPGIEDAEPRYSPFDLALLAGWLRDDPSLSPSAIAAGDTDPYVELRIVQRMQDARLRAALPAIVALGRFDLPMLRPALPPELTGDEAKVLFAELADYEWIDIQSDGDQTFLAIHAALLPRLRRYYEHVSRQSSGRAARERLAPALRTLVTDTSLAELRVTHLETALAILEPADAARLWIEVLVRVPSEADREWLRVVTERLRSDDGIGERQPTLAAGFEAASYIVGRMLATRTSPVPAPMVAIDRWPDGETGEWLRRCEQIIDVGGIDDPRRALVPIEALASNLERRLADIPTDADASRFARLSRRLAEEEAGALLVAVDGIAARLLWPGAPQADADALGEMRAAVSMAFSALGVQTSSANLIAMSRLADAKLALAGADRQDAQATLVSNLAAVPVVAPGPPRRWLHWRAPESLIDRVRLEALWLQREFGLTLDVPVEAWWPGASERGGGIDGERLASAILRWRLDRGVVPTDDDSLVFGAPLYEPERHPTAQVHDETPPFFVSLAKAQAAEGRRRRAMRLLDDVADAAERSRRDLDTVQVAALTKLEIGCHAREAVVVPPAAREAAQNVGDNSIVLAERHLAALTGSPLPPAAGTSWHDRWRTTTAPGKDLEAAGSEGPPLDERFLFAERLDLVELTRCAQESPFTGFRPVMPTAAPVGRIDRLEDLVRAMVRTYALLPLTDAECPAAIRVPRVLRSLLPFSFRFAAAPGVPNRSPENEQPVDRDQLSVLLNLWEKFGTTPTDSTRFALAIGARRLEQVILEEGELLALRLPISALRLLDVAATLAGVIGDPVAKVRAETAAQLVRGRLGEPWRDGAFTERVEPAWRAASAAGADQPSWEAIVGEDPSRRSASSSSLPPAAIRILIGRLLEQGSDHKSIQPSLAAIGLTVGVPEFGSDRIDEEPGSPLEKSDVHAASSRTATWQSLAFKLIVGVASALPITGIVAFFKSDLGVLVLGTVGAVGMLVGATVVARVLRRWLTAWIASGSLVSISAASTQGADDLRIAAGETFASSLTVSGVRARFPSWPPFPRLTLLEIAHELSLPSTRRQPYADAVAAFDERSLDDLAEIQRDVAGAGGLWPVPIRATAVNWVPWEALLTGAAGGAQGPAEPLFFYRIRAGATRAWTYSTLFAVIWSRPSVLLVGRARVMADGWVDGNRRLRAATVDDSNQDVGIVHAIGTPVLTAARPRLRLGGDGVPARVKRANLEQLEEAAIDVDFLQREQLPYAIPLLIVQQTPAEAPRRLTTDREQAALLREVAADLFETRCGAAIVIPSLPPELAAAVQASLARALRPNGFSRSLLDWALEPAGVSTPGRELRRLARAVRAMRQVVLDWPDFAHPEDPRREAAWDICLYADHRPWM